ncbi:UNVERIFIED_CONTAM: Sister chromatid cohesion 1 protein 2 [Sesamum indicum]
MFYSQLLLSKKGALGIVWMAAHCHKRLKKDQVQQTDISSSVDKILNDEVPVVTHRILAFLLLGVVRIYSKKVEYLYNDCHEVLNTLCGFKTGKSARGGGGVSLRRYHSITLPKRFELDAFDLELLEGQGLVGGKVRSHKKVMHAGILLFLLLPSFYDVVTEKTVAHLTCDTSLENSTVNAMTVSYHYLRSIFTMNQPKLQLENMPTEAQSTAHTPPREMTENYLSRKFQDKKRQNEEDVLNLSQLLEGKTKKQSARLFYELLVLKSRGSVDVQQESAYDDILVRQTSKLKDASQWNVEK